MAKIFLSCKAATKLLESERFIKPILIDILNISRAETRIHSESESNLTALIAHIFIPESSLQTTQALRDLAFGIFNAQRSVQRTSLYQRAALGNIDMDSYARQSEQDELAKSQGHFELIKQCGNHWKMSPEELKIYTRNENQYPEMHLFVQEVFCHTDFFRQEWTQKYQEPYCKKHPADSRSCKTKKTDLCDDTKVKSMPDAKKAELVRERICKLFPQAHVKVQNDPGIRKIVQDECPEVLETSNQPRKEEL